MDLKELCKKYFETFSAKDLNSLAEMFDENIYLRDWETSAAGVDLVLQANQQIFNAVNTIQVTPISMYQDGNVVACELDIEINGVDKILVVDIIEFNGDKIASVKAYRG